MRRKNDFSIFRFPTNAHSLHYILPLGIYISCSLLMVFTPPLTAQIINRDSLLSVVKTQPDDTNKVNTLQLLAMNYFNQSRDYTKVGEFAWKELALSQKLNYEKGLANSYSFIGSWYGYKGNKEMALFHYKKSLRLMQKLKNKKGEANIYNNIARIQVVEGDYVASLSNYLKSLKIRETLNDKEGMALAYLNIGNVFSTQGKLDEALGYYIKSMQLLEGNVSTSLSNVYNNIGNIYAEKKKHKDALTYHLKALKICEKLNDKVGIVGSYNSIGSDHFRQQQQEAALLYHQKAYALALESGNKTGQAFACEGIGNINQAKKNYAEASAYYSKMLKLGTELDNKRIIQIVYNDFVSLYQETGNFKQALVYTKLVNSMKDSLLGLESQRQISELMTKYQTEKSTKEILLLTKEKELNTQQLKQQTFVRWVLIVGLILLLITVIGIYKRYLFKQKINLQLMQTQNELYKMIEQKEKLTSILAHDLRTPLRFMMTVTGYLSSSIRVVNKERLEKLSKDLNTSAKNTYAFADELLTWLSVQNQNFTVQHSEVNVNTLINELFEFFQDIAISQHTALKTELPLSVSVETDKRLLKIILRNILDNAIKHTNPGEVIVSVSQQNDEVIEIRIRDTGSGMTKEQLEQLDISNTHGFEFEIKNKLGFQIIKDLSALLNIKLDIHSERDIGTAITLYLPSGGNKTE
jgi:signal transduction histidine kinase